MKVLARGADYEDLLDEYPDEPTFDDGKGESPEDELENEDAALSVEAHMSPLPPLAEAYITRVLGDAPKSELGLVPPSDPNYDEIMSRAYSISPFSCQSY